MKFTVIQGGLAQAKNASPEPAPTGARMSETAAEEERLRRAILRLPVPDSCLNVEQALDEICSRLDEVDIDKSEPGEHLCWQLQQELGLRFHLVNPELGLARPGYLGLFNPAALLAAHPELASDESGP